MVFERGSTLSQTSFIRVQLSQRDSDRAISVRRYNMVGIFKRFEYCSKDKLRIIETEVVDNQLSANEMKLNGFFNLEEIYYSSVCLIAE